MLYIKKISIILICIFFLIGCKQYDSNKPVPDVQYIVDICEEYIKERKE